jgi:hypothetical protein
LFAVYEIFLREKSKVMKCFIKSLLKSVTIGLIFLNLSVFLMSNLKAAAQVPAQALSVQANFLPALTGLGPTPTPAAISTIVTNYCTGSNAPYAGYLTDYPSATAGLFSKIGAFFTNNVPNATDIATLTALQKLLGNGIPPYTALNPLLMLLLSVSEQATASTWLTNVNTAINTAQNKAAFVAYLTSVTAQPTTLQNILGGLQSIKSYGSGASAALLIDYPTPATGIFAAIQTNFFNPDNSLKSTITNTSTSQNLTALQMLLKGSTPTSLSTSLANLLSPTEQATALVWLNNVNAAVTTAQVVSSFASAVTALKSSAKPVGDINTILTTYGTATGLAAADVTTLYNIIIAAANAVLTQTPTSLPAYLALLTSMLKIAKSCSIFSTTQIGSSTSTSGLTYASTIIGNIALTDSNSVLYVTKTPATLNDISTLLSTTNFTAAVKAWRSLKTTLLS